MIAVESTVTQEEDMVMLCTLRVGAALFAIEANLICEVLGEMSSKIVPLAPKYVAGVIPYRGEVVTTVSLRHLLGIEDATASSCVLVLNDEEADERYGLVVDGVQGLVTVARDSLEPNPTSLDASSAFLFDGLYRTTSGLMARLNTQQLRPSRITQTGLFEHAQHETRGWTQ
jgi:purine-binding chemotaxis protein CheW